MLTMQLHKAAAVFLLVAITASARAADLLPPDRPIADVIDHYVDAKLDGEYARQKFEHAACD